MRDDNNIMKLLIIFSLFVTCFLIVEGEQVAMKIVEEPSSYGWNNVWDQRQQQRDTTETKLTMRVSPANFSGPAHLQRLLGKCFSMDDDNYSYEICHFANITQREKALRWNPYHGILGVYQEWEIVNNTFVAMLYKEGDTCGGSAYRRVRVLFTCGEKNQLTNVSEPKMCHYEAAFLTPYVCHPHSMLVYPTLSKELQTSWDNLEGELYEEMITKQGYKKQLSKVFEKAGYYLSGSKKKELAKKAKEEEKRKENESKGEFETLSKCTKEYNKLKKEVEGLRALLALQGNEGIQGEENVGNEDNSTTPHVTNSTAAERLPVH